MKRKPTAKQIAKKLIGDTSENLRLVRKLRNLGISDTEIAKALDIPADSGVGVDGIQAVCSVCVFGELDWSPGVMEQCIGRINRDGQIGGALAYFLVSEAGSDPVVSAVLNLKTSQATGLTDPDKATEIETLQVETGRVKKLAAAWLEKKGLR